MAVGVTMLIEEFFGVVDRAFAREANRIPALSRLELGTALELPLPVADRRHTPERRLLPGAEDRRRRHTCPELISLGSGS